MVFFFVTLAKCILEQQSRLLRNFKHTEFYQKHLQVLIVAMEKTYCPGP